MPINKYMLHVDGKDRQVSEENIKQYGMGRYASSYPNATVRMRDDDGTDYDIPIGEYDKAVSSGLHPFLTTYYDPSEKVDATTAGDSIAMIEAPKPQETQTPAPQAAAIPEQPEDWEFTQEEIDSLTAQTMAGARHDGYDPASKTSSGGVLTEAQKDSVFEAGVRSYNERKQAAQAQRAEQEKKGPASAYSPAPDAWAGQPVNDFAQYQETQRQTADWGGTPLRQPESERQRQVREAMEEQSIIDNLWNSELKGKVDQLIEAGQAEGRKKLAEYTPSIYGRSNFGYGIGGVDDRWGQEYLKATDSKKVIEGVQRYLSEKQGTGGEGTGTSGSDPMQEKLMQKVYDYLVQKNTPKSTAEYILRNVMETSILGQLNSMGNGKSYEQRQIEAQGLQSYDASTGEEIGAMAASIAADLPVMRLTGAVGGLAGNALLRGATKRLVAGGMSEAVARGVAARAAQQGGMKWGLRAASEALNFGTLEGAGSAVGQLYQTGEVDLGDVAQSFAKGTATGAIMGVFGVSNDHFRRMMEGAVGETAGRAIGYGTSLGGRTAILTGSSVMGQYLADPNFDIQNVDWTKEVSHAALMNIGFDILGAAKRYQAERKSGIKMRDLEKLNLTKEDIRELNDAGIDGKNAQEIAESVQNLNDIKSVLGESGIPLNVRSKVAYLMTGQHFNLAPITGVSSSVEGSNGQFYVETYDISGQVSERRRFTSHKKALNWLLDKREESMHNLANIMEVMVDNAGKIYKSTLVFDLVANMYGDSREHVAEAYNKHIKGEWFSTNEEKKIADAVDNAFAALENVIQHDYNTSILKERAAKKLGKDVAWLEKKLKDKHHYGHLHALDAYLETLSEVLQGRGTETMGQPAGRDTYQPTEMRPMIEGRVEEPVPPVPGEGPVPGAGPVEGPAPTPSSPREASRQTGAALYAEHDPVKMRQAVVREEVARERALAAVGSEEDLERLGELDEATLEEAVAGMDANTQRLVGDWIAQKELVDGMDEALDAAHEAEIEEAERKVLSMAPIGDEIPLVPLGKYGDSEHTYGVVVSGIDASRQLTNPSGLAVVVPLTNDPTGAPDYNSFDPTNTLSGTFTNDAVRWAHREDVIVSMLPSYEADASLLDVPVIEPGTTVQIADLDGNVANLHILAQGPGDSWIVQEEGMNGGMEVPEEELAEMMAQAERLPILQEYAELDKSYEREQREKQRQAERQAEREARLAREAEEAARIADEMKKPINRLAKYPEGHKKAGMPDYESSRPEDVRAYLVESLGLDGAIKSIRSQRAGLERQVDELTNKVSTLIRENEQNDYYPDEAIAAQQYISTQQQELDRLKKRLSFWQNMEVITAGPSEKAIQETVARSQATQKATRTKRDTYKPSDAYVKLKKEISDSSTALDVLNDLEPHTPEELAATLIGGGVRLMKGDETVGGALLRGVMSQTGFGTRDLNRVNFIFATRANGGVSVAEFGEMMETAAHEYGVRFDGKTQEPGVTALLNLLGEVEKMGDITRYVENHRMEEAATLYDAENAAIENAMDEAAWEEYGMSYAELEMLQDAISESLAERKGFYEEFVKTEAYNDFISTFAENKDYGIERNDLTGVAAGNETAGSYVGDGSGRAVEGNQEPAGSVQPVAGLAVEREPSAQDQRGAAIERAADGNEDRVHVSSGSGAGEIESYRQTVDETYRKMPFHAETELATTEADIDRISGGLFGEDVLSEIKDCLNDKTTVAFFDKSMGIIFVFPHKHKSTKELVKSLWHENAHYFIERARIEGKDEKNQAALEVLRVNYPEAYERLLRNYSPKNIPAEAFPTLVEEIVESEGEDALMKAQIPGNREADYLFYNFINFTKDGFGPNRYRPERTGAEAGRVGKIREPRSTAGEVRPADGGSQAAESVPSVRERGSDGAGEGSGLAGKPELPSGYEGAESEAGSRTDPGYTVEKRHHAQQNKDIWAVKFEERFDRDKFLELKDEAKKFGGYYSRFGKGGFIFKTEEDARKFGESVVGARDSRNSGDAGVDAGDRTNELKPSYDEQGRETIESQAGHSRSEAERLANETEPGGVEDASATGRGSGTSGNRPVASGSERPSQVNGYRLGEKVVYKGQEATIYDFEKDGTPVLDTGMGPVIYEVGRWEDIQKLPASREQAVSMAQARTPEKQLERAEQRQQREKPKREKQKAQMADLFARADALDEVLTRQEQEIDAQLTLMAEYKAGPKAQVREDMHTGAAKTLEKAARKLAKALANRLGGHVDGKDITRGLTNIAPIGGDMTIRVWMDDAQTNGVLMNITFDAVPDTRDFDKLVPKYGMWRLIAGDDPQGIKSRNVMIDELNDVSEMQSGAFLSKVADRMLEEITRNARYSGQDRNVSSKQAETNDVLTNKEKDNDGSRNRQADSGTSGTGEGIVPDGRTEGNPPADQGVGTAAREETERADRGRDGGSVHGNHVPDTEGSRGISASNGEQFTPIGDGPFGKIYDQFKGKVKEAISFLRKIKSGEAIGALHHKDVGDIDLVWGNEGTGKSNGFGLSKLIKFHPEVLDDLQGIINDMEVVSRSENRINLESKTHKAAVRLEWDGKRKNWLLTAFEKEKPTATDRTTDIGDTKLQNDTAPLQTVSSSEDKDSELRNTIKRNTNNFSYGEAHLELPTGEIGKLKGNIEAIRTLKELEASGQPATPEQKQALLKFVGWGGLAEALNSAEYADWQRKLDGARRWGWDLSTISTPWSKKWGKHYEELRPLMTDEEWATAQASTLNSHYTPEPVIRGLWQALEYMGFKGGSIQEPAMGIGHILGFMPKHISERSLISGFELDGIPGRIAKQLYPDADITVAGYETVFRPASKDAIVTNVPFGQTAPVDPALDKALRKKIGGAYNLHNYFIIKGLLELRPGGVGAFITSASTLDGRNTKAREYIAGMGVDLVGAIRLPNNTFKDNAGTEVTADMLFFRKRLPGESSNGIAFTSLSQVGTGTYKTKDKNGNEELAEVPLLVNEYFAEHPEMMLGTVMTAHDAGSGGLYGGDNLTLVAHPNTELSAELADAIGRLPEGVYGKTFVDMVLNKKEKTTQKDGALSVKGGRVYVASKGELSEIASGSFKHNGKTRSYADATTDYQALKETLKELIKAEQTQVKDPTALREKLNEQYDRFVEKYGRLNENKNLNVVLEEDPERFLPQSLEKVETVTNPTTGRRTKVVSKGTGILSQRVSQPMTEPTTAGNLSDAIGISQSYRGHMDVDYIANMLGIPADEARDRILTEREAYEDPITGELVDRDAYLSGNVREKLENARAAAEHDPRYESNVADLEKAMPESIPFVDIFYKMGTPWIPVDVYETFAREVCGIDGLEIRYSPVIDQFVIVSKGYINDHVKANNFSTDRRDVKQLFEDAINLRKPTIYDTVQQGGVKRQVKNEADTQAAISAIMDMNDAFVQYVQGAKEHHARLTSIYNDRYNNYRLREYREPSFKGADGKVHYPNANPGITLRTHQVKGVQRSLQGSTLLAHQVGTGKTFTMITTAMEMRRLGIAKKPMIVVQNATLQDFAADFMKLYPGAKILVPNETERSASQRKRLFNLIATGDFDAIIVPQSFLAFIPDDEGRKKALIQKRVDEMMAAADEIAVTDKALANRLKREAEAIALALREDKDLAPKKGKRVKDQAKQQEKAVVRETKKLDRRTDDVLTFEQMGVDALFIDEAHNYKKVGFTTKMQNVKGVDTGYSERANSLYLKVTYVQEKMGGRNVILATGTPITNTMAEVWTMMRFVAPEILEDYGIRTFDEFAATFGQVEPSLEQNSTGGFKIADRFKSYVNVPELVKAFRSHADVVLTSDVQEFKQSKNIPKLKDGRMTNHVIQKSDQLQEVMDVLIEALKEDEKKSGNDKTPGLPLVVFSKAKQAAIDLRLINPEYPDDPDSKTNKVVSEVVRIYRESTPDKGIQMIFCDSYQSPSSEPAIDLFDYNPEVPQFNLYRDIKQKLIEQGIPKEEIVIVSEISNADRKKAVFEKARAGEVRVLIGGTEKMGVGVNVQDRMIALHHMDAPIRPMDFEQRNGRILRQGNMFAAMDKPVEVVTYGVEGTLDATAYERLRIKQDFINQMMKGDVSGRVMEEQDDEDPSGKTFSQMAAELSGDKTLQLLFIAENKVKKLEGLRRSFELRKENARLDASLSKSNLASCRRELKVAEKLAKEVAERFPDGITQLTINGNPVTEKMSKELADMLERYEERYSKNRSVVFPVVLLNNGDAKMVFGHTLGQLQYSLYVDEHALVEEKPINSYAGVWLSVNSALGNTGKRVKEIEEKIRGYESRIEGAESLQSKEFDKMDELKAARQEVKNLKDELAKKAKGSEESRELKLAIRRDQVFYSNAERAIEQIKQEKATPQQWLAMIEKNGGLKAGEDKWIGLSDWLKESDKKSLAKQELLDYLEQNKIQVQDVEYVKDYKEQTERYSNAIASVLGGPIGKAKYGRYYGADGYNLSISGPREDVEATKRMLAEKYGVDKNKIYTEVWKQVQDIQPPKEINQARLKYTTEGLENHREIALTVPTIEPWNVSDKVHFGDAGKGRAVVWVRFGDAYEAKETGRNKDWDAFMDEMSEKYGKPRTDTLGLLSRMSNEDHDRMHQLDKDIREQEKSAKNRVLVIDEIQSSRHQKGRGSGYAPIGSYTHLKQAEEDLLNANSEVQSKEAKFNEYIKQLADKYGSPVAEYTEEEKQKVQSLVNDWTASKEKARDLSEIYDKAVETISGVPAAPFEKNWSELAMKRMLRYAAENGYDKVAWTTGVQQADRYSLGQVIDEVMSSEWKKNQNGWGDGSADVVKTVYANGADIELQYVVDKNGTIIADINGQHEGRSLGEVFGKEIATKLMADEGTTISNAELKIGGEGMKGFYDKMLPSFVSKYVKKWGSKVQDIELSDVEKAGRIMHSVDITDAMKESVMQGQPLFAQERNKVVSLPEEMAGDSEESLDRMVTAMQPFESVAANAPEMVIAQSTSDILKAMPGIGSLQFAAIVREASRPEVQAMYVPWTRQIILLPNKGTVKEMRDKRWHESLHFGIDMVLPKDDSGRLMLERAGSEVDQLSPELSAWVKDTYGDRNVAEEKLVHLVEEFISYLEDAGKVRSLLDGVDFGSRYPVLNDVVNRVINYLTNNGHGKESDNYRGYDEGSEPAYRGEGEEGRVEEDFAAVRDGQSEEEAIIARAKADGTYMKAPNGKPTNLTEKQWVQVRTQAFKKWFGDWELPLKTVRIISSPSKISFNLKQKEATAKKEIVEWAKKNGIIKELTDKESGGKGIIHITPKSIEKIVDDVYNLHDEQLQQQSLNLLSNIEDLIRESVLGESHVGYKKGKDGKRSPLNGFEKGITIFRYFGAVDIDGRIYRAKTTVKRTDYKDYQKVYTYEITKIELLDGKTAGEESNSPTSNNSITFANLLKGVENDNKNGDKILNSSKVVDENGEPMVVYHGTGADFDIFGDYEGYEGNTFWFAENEVYSDEFTPYGGDNPRIVKAYLNLKNPFDLRTEPLEGFPIIDKEHLGEETFAAQEDIDRLADILGVTPDEVLNEYDGFTIWTVTQSKAFADALKSKGYDGIQFMEEMEPTWGAFEPNQIKSATENVGTFDEAEPSIKLGLRGKPRRKQGESIISFNKRLKEWQSKMEAAKRTRAVENLDAVNPVDEELNNLAMEMMEHPVPIRKPGESDEDFTARQTEWSEWYNNRLPEINARMSELKAELERQSSNARSKEIEETESSLYTGEVPPQKDETGELTDEEMREVRESFQEKMKDAQISVTKDQIRRDIKQEIIERRRYIETSNLEDAFFVDQVKKSAGSAEVLKALPDYIEGTYTGEETPELVNTAKMVKDWFEEVYNLMAQEGVLYDAPKIQNYVTHIWDWKRSPKEAQERYTNWVNTMRLRSPFTKHRVIPSYKEGMAMGMVPKYDDITGILLEYGHYATETIANKRMLEFLKNFRVFIEGGKDNLPMEVDVIVPETAKDANYSRMNHTALEGYKVLNAIKPFITPVFGDQRIIDPSHLNPLTNRLIDGVWATSGLMKKIALSFSFFHHGALTETAIAMMKPHHAAKVIAKNLFWDVITKGNIPAMNDKEAARDAVKHLVSLGASNDYVTADVNNLTTQLHRWTKDKHIPVAQQAAYVLDFLNKGSDKILWDTIHDGYKIASFEMMAREIRAKAKREGWSHADLEKSLDEAGHLVNDTYGGLHFDILGFSPKSVRIMRALLLSPDWTLATVRQALSPFGFGKLYGDEGFWRTIGGGENPVKTRKKYGRAFWLTAIVFFYGLMNGLNAYFRAKDEEEMRQEAEEMRKVDKTYKSPYELAYPNGMKWHDYLMPGNTLSHQTHLFTGRYEDGTERYARWGKQFRELPELFFGRDGFSFPGPMIDKLSGKANPFLASVFEFVSGHSLSGWENVHMKDKKGWERDVARLYLLASKFVPYSVPTQEDKDFYWLDLVMPSSKGFTPGKAINYFEKAILSGDMNFVAGVYNACVTNGLQPEKYFNVAKARIEAEAKAESLEDVETLQDATKKFDDTTDLKERKRLLRYMEQQIGAQDYRAISQEELLQQAIDLINGEMPDPSASDRYLESSSSDDFIEDYRMKKNAAGLKKYYQDYTGLAAEDPEAAKLMYAEKRKYIEGYVVTTKYRSAINKLKKALTREGADSVLILKEIRKLRKEYFDTMDSMELQ